MEQKVVKKKVKNKILKLSLVADKGKLRLKIKTSSNWEKFLSNTRSKNEVTVYEDGKARKRQAYIKEIKWQEQYIEDLGFPWAGFSAETFNTSIFRLVGISKGVEIQLRTQVSIEKLKATLKKMAEAFKKIYADYCVTTKIRVEVVE